MIWGHDHAIEYMAPILLTVMARTSKCLHDGYIYVNLFKSAYICTRKTAPQNKQIPKYKYIINPYVYFKSFASVLYLHVCHVILLIPQQSSFRPINNFSTFLGAPQYSILAMISGALFRQFKTILYLPSY